MQAIGINTVRVYTAPPPWLLDSAQFHDLKVIIGLCWEQHVVDFIEQNRAKQILASVGEQVRQCNNHPAILAFTLGNEIPSSIVRWHGAKRVEKFLHGLYQLVKSLAPNSLVTYVNFPPTEYLELPFVDFTQIQADVLDWQLDTCRSAGLAGAIVFAWTDEWYRGGADIDDWDFGLVDRNRQPKPALTSVSLQFNKSIKEQLAYWPHVTVAICTYNGSRTLVETLEVLDQHDYPNFDVLVIDDGSTDHTRELALAYSCTVISTENYGLSSARNTAWQNSDGQIVVYLDDDAYPDSNWLYHIAAQFDDDQVGAVGGPNLPPSNSSDIAFCVSHSPGGPNHVLESDTIAEHIPGCNMAIRRQVLEELGGFDVQFRAAGDDVDMCWRIRDCGWVIRFSPCAVVFHHRRDTAKGYFQQQRGYGMAEALLANKYPGRVNELGHLSWSGVIYGTGLKQALGTSQSKVNYGVWGSGLFQSIYRQPASGIFPMTLIPESLLAMGLFSVIGCAGVFWPPLYLSLVIAALILICILIQGVYDTNCNLAYVDYTNNKRNRFTCWWLTLSFHLFQPIVRLQGRLKGGITPHRSNPKPALSFRHNRHLSIWSESYVLPETVLTRLKAQYERIGLSVRTGSTDDRWDLNIGAGGYRKVKLLMAMEEHGGDDQMFRFKLRSYIPAPLAGLTCLGLALTLAAFLAGSWLGSITLAIPTLYFLSLALSDQSTVVLKQLEGFCAEQNMIIVNSSKLRLNIGRPVNRIMAFLRAMKSRLSLDAKRL